MQVSSELRRTGWVLAFLCATQAFAQLDVLTTRYENRTLPGHATVTNAVMLGLGSGMDSMRWYEEGSIWGLILGRLDQPHYRTTIGAPIAAQPADTFLGQIIVPPDDVDLNVAPSVTTLDGSGDAVWIDYAQVLIASGVGAVEVTWVLTGGKKAVVYTVSPQPQKRPVRLYWTHQRPTTSFDPGTTPTILPLQNAGPTIQFGSNYRVEIYTNATIHSFDSVTYNPGDSCGYVRLNGTELQAFNDTRGSFLLAYSRWDEVTAKRELLAYEIVNVLEPMSTKLDVDIGGQLKPLSRSFETEALFPTVTRGMVDESGNNEIYVYQHAIGPQKDWLWAIRDTVDKAWKIEVYWRAREELDVLWPFEVDIYEARWNATSAQLYARDPVTSHSTIALPDPKVYVPATMNVQAMPYQVPSGHAFASVGSYYTTYGSQGTNITGYALLRYSSGDLVWFETLHSVAGDNPAVFTCVAQEAVIPEEITDPLADADGFFYPGWIKTRDASADPVMNPYNVNTYRYPIAYVSTNLLNSAVFPVNAGCLEVWWAQGSRFNKQPADGADYVAPLPAPVFIPCTPSLYQAHYPTAGTVWDDVPTQIVIASGKGSTGGTLNDFGPVTGPNLETMGFNEERTANLLGGVLSSNFTFEIWLKAESDRMFGYVEMARFSRVLNDNTTNTLFSLGMHSGNLDIYIDDINFVGEERSYSTDFAEFPSQFNPYGRGQIISGGIAPTEFGGGGLQPLATIPQSLSPVGTWHHFAVTKQADGTCIYYINGHPAAEFDIPDLPGINFSGDLFSILKYYQGSAMRVRLWSKARTWQQILAGRYQSVAKPDNNLIAEYLMEPTKDADTGLYAFDYSDRLIDSSGNKNTIMLGESDLLTVDDPDAFHKRNNGMVFAGGNEQLYVQRDRMADGYNPNEEHALLMSGIAYALRCDLNTTNAVDYTSEPFVLVQYTDADTGKTRMKALQVIPENDMYRFAQFMEAGQMVQSPAPLGLLQPANWHTFIDGPTLAGQSTCFKDRKDWFWAQQAGDDGGHTNYVFDFEYPHQESFDYPDGSALAVGTAIKWMANYTGRGEYWPVRDPEDMFGSPINYTFHVLWPSEVPRLYVGDTLTNPKNDLPSIRGQLSAAVLYEQSLHHKPKPEVDGFYPSVHLIDPTVARKVPMNEVPGPLKSYRDPRTAFTFFSELPPLLRERLYWNPAAQTDEEFQLIGQYRDGPDNQNYLLLNVLDGRAYSAATNPVIVTGAEDPSWVDGLDKLPGGGEVLPVTDDSKPFDSLALATDGRGAGYVTIAFNNSTNRAMVDPSESVFLNVIKVEPELYQGELDPILSPNPLDKQMNLKYTADFSGRTERWKFQWQYGEPDNGRAPSTEDATKWFVLQDNSGTDFADYATIGDAGVFGLSDHYVRCRYQALDPQVVNLVSTNWSGWTSPQLAEGWIKRVLKAVNPFDQRIRDYLNVALNTDLSMVQQAGQPYSGDIPLNQDALNDYGLIPIYETLLRQARKLSIDGNYPALDSLALALQMAAGRISELYMVLGNEALADAMNPTVDLGSQAPVDDFAESSIFCFQNQQSSLLEEELALLRGRDLSWEYLQAAEYPIPPSSFPTYNRLVWNFTYDIMGGQVAYVLNYGISDLKGNNDGSLDTEDGKALFPQGHGDAYGHYLSAIKGYYYLLRHRNFGWLPQVEGILAGDTEVTISYFHEKRFVMAAVAKARTAQMIVERTHRDRYCFGAADAWELAEDDDQTVQIDEDEPDVPVDNRHWGVDEWATRGHLGAYFDWLTANALLPSRQANEVGIRIIDREGTPELQELADISRRIQRDADKADSGLNPLGLADNAIPFDISPSEIDAGKTHFEQINERARRALSNAAEAFKRVKHVSNALRDQNEARDFDTMVDDEEAAINRRLIEVYGYPYADDIGPGKNYSQDYLGPDLLNYTYIDLYDLDNSYTSVGGRYFTVDVDHYLPINQTINGVFQAEIDSSMADLGGMGNIEPGTMIYTIDELESDDEVLQQWVNLPAVEQPVFVVDNGSNLLDGQVTYRFNVVGWTNQPQSVRYYVAPDGFTGKPPSYTGQRRAEGEIQIALAEYGVQIFAMKDSQQAAQAAATLVRTKFDELRAYDYESLMYLPVGVAYDEVRAFYEEAKRRAEELSSEVDGIGQIKGIITDAGVEGFPKVVGMASDLTSPARSALKALSAGVQDTLNLQQADQQAKIAALELKLEEIEGLVEDALDFSVNNTERRRMLSDILGAAQSAKAAVSRLSSIVNVANAARMRFAAAEAEGDQLQVERERLRLQWSSDLSTRRYRNMMYQIMRNDELQRYNETFETAARYCYLAARAYDYETGLLASDATHTAGRDFMTQIVKTRALGRFSLVNGSPVEPLGGGSVGDPGLADILFRMNENWTVLKGRLGFNNPQDETDVFSLRSELFRKVPDASGDSAWRDVLQNTWRANLRDMPEFQRYCLPFAPMADVEPGFAIPFSSTVSFRKNFFGQDLDAGDNAFDSSYFATKIRGVGIWFQGYSSNVSTGLANRPQVYLVPAGVDFMRVPIQATGEAVATRGWQVLDQVLPLPYPLADSQWESPDWSALKNLCGNELWTIRKYPSLRAFLDSGYTPEQMSYNARLVGRSVWNSQWWIIIPAGSLHFDDETARTRFLRDVKDIKLYLKTYSFSGN